MWVYKLLLMQLPRLLIAIAIAFIAGYWYGNSNANENWQNKLQAAENKRLLEVRAIESESLKKVQNLSNDYEIKTNDLQSKLDIVERDYSRLRVKSCSNSVPTNTPSPKPNNAATPAPGRVEAVEINLDGIAKEIIRLGGDLDQCYITVSKLQEFIKLVTN